MFFKNNCDQITNVIKEHCLSNSERLDNLTVLLNNLYSSVINPIHENVNSLIETLDNIEKSLSHQEKFNHSLELKYTELILNIQNFLGKFEEILKGVKGIKIKELKPLRHKKLKKKL